jgi:hypothetical protein
MRLLRTGCAFVLVAVTWFVPPSSPTQGQCHHCRGQHVVVTLREPPTRWAPGRNVAGKPEMLFTGVSCPSAKFCAAVGYSYPDADGEPGYTHPLAQMWNGERWRAVDVPTAPIGDLGLTDVSCTSARFCMAVGTNRGRTYSVKWNGTAWSFVRSKHSQNSRHQGLDMIDCPSPNRCFSVGNVYHLGGTHAVAERWNGKSWLLMEQPGDANGYIRVNGISCPSTTWCVLVGDDSTSGGTSGTSQVYLATWQRGSHGRWVRSHIPDPSSQRKAVFSKFDDVSCVSRRRCLAVGGFTATSGSSGDLLEQWDGSHWIRKHTTMAVSKISCTARTHCVAMAEGTNPTSDVLSGSTWHNEPFVDQSSWLRAIDCATAHACFAVGSTYYAHPARTLSEFRGRAWRVVPSP